MKPREFDELVRQKFEQGDFEYNPQQWDVLAEKLEGGGKRRAIMFWWMPLVGVAASVALAFGINKVMLQDARLLQAPAQVAASNAMPINKAINPDDINNVSEVAPQELVPTIVDAQNAAVTTTENATASTSNQHDGYYGLCNKQKHCALNTQASNELSLADYKEREVSNVALNMSLAATKKKLQTRTVYASESFKPMEAPKALPKVALNLTGGLNFGSVSSGYSIGAAARRMVNDKVYVEGDIAFMGSSNVHNVSYIEMPSAQGGSMSSSITNSTTTMQSKNINSKNTTNEANGGKEAANAGVVKTAKQSYNLYYAQITPTVGYKILKKLSVGAGPDFQQILIDNRPEPNALDRGTIKEAPMFDIGLMGKTEYNITKSIQAAVSYREGISNIITPTNKYIDRNYVQVQLRCTILNK